VKKALATLVLFLSPALALASDGARFDLVLLESGKPVAQPSVWVAFGEQAVLEVPGKVRVIASAQAPSDASSEVTAEIYSFNNGVWERVSAPSMQADLSKTPSFEQTITNSPYKVVLMPRLAAHPQSSRS